MANQATINKLSRKLEHVQRELRVLRSLAISVAGEDPEGSYRPEFVREILRASKEKLTYRFTTPEAFLKDVERA